MHQARSHRGRDLIEQGDPVIGFEVGEGGGHLLVLKGLDEFFLEHRRQVFEDVGGLLLGQQPVQHGALLGREAFHHVDGACGRQPLGLSVGGRQVAVDQRPPNDLHRIAGDDGILRPHHGLLDSVLEKGSPVSTRAGPGAAVLPDVHVAGRSSTRRNASRGQRLTASLA